VVPSTATRSNPLISPVILDTNVPAAIMLDERASERSLTFSFF
jgi:hypothetical protein